MITIHLNRPGFAYEVHSLVKAFYPDQEVRVTDPVNAGGKAPERAPGEETQEPLKLVVSFFVSEEAQAAGGGPEVCRERPQDIPEDRGAREEPEVCRERAQDTPEGREPQKPQEVPEGREPQKPQEVPEGREPQKPQDIPEGREPQKSREASGCGTSVRLLSGDRMLCQDELRLAPDAPEKEIRDELKRLLYRMFSAHLGRKLPWGSLTGIRPTRIPMGLLEQGWKNAQIAQYMRENYYTSNEKTALAVSIANRERHILRDIHYKDGYSLYVGIPFCPSICLYCSFSSSPLYLWKDRVDTYLDALCKEIDYASGAFADRELNTLYIGGGTPTTLEPYQLERLLSKLEQSFSLGGLREFTVEAGRPDSITREKLEVLKNHGVSRISINPQTMNQSTLDFIGRRHTVEETVAAFGLARSMGFDNINMDLIVGLPGEGAPEVEHTMQELSKLGPDSITVHSLAVKRASRLKLFREEHREMTMTNSQEIMEMTARYTREAGMFPYYLYRQKNMAGNFENVGYAREGKEGLYNILIMEELQTILALGAGAATRLVLGQNRFERIENVKDIKNYIERIDEMIERKRSVLS